MISGTFTATGAGKNRPSTGTWSRVRDRAEVAGLDIGSSKLTDETIRAHRRTVLTDDEPNMRNDRVDGTGLAGVMPRGRISIERAAGSTTSGGPGSGEDQPSGGCA